MPARSSRRAASSCASAHFQRGHNVGIGKDDTLFAKVAGKVAFERKGKYNRQVSVYTAEEAM